MSRDASPDPAVRLLKSGTCSSLSGKSKLTYQIGLMDETEPVLRIATNTGGGFFNDVWVALAAIEKVVHGTAAKKGLTSTTLHPLCKGKSVNTAGFLLAVLKHEGAIQLQEGKTRLYEVADFDAFLGEGAGAYAARIEQDAHPKGQGSDARKESHTAARFQARVGLHRECLSLGAST